MIPLDQRIEAGRWLISHGARRRRDAARTSITSWRHNRTRHSGHGVDSVDRAVLRATNPELQALRRRYARRSEVLGTSVIWRRGHVTSKDLLYFRGDNCYVWQFRDNNTAEKYILTYLYLKTIDSLGILDTLTEDGDFGVFTFPTGDTPGDGTEKLVSRDLLDSACELLFLERMLQISRWPGLRVLDIGAGYGRLGYRAVTALDNIDTYFCIDAIPESTFVCSHYLGKKQTERTCVVPFDDQQDLVPGTINLAVNIHSFSECPIKAVDYWVSRCAELEIEYLFIVPNVSEGEDAVRLLNGTNVTPLLRSYGYDLCHVEPKYRNAGIQNYGVSPKWYYLFRATA